MTIFSFYSFDVIFYFIMFTKKYQTMGEMADLCLMNESSCITWSC